jgi:hypothetical protein
VQSSREAAIKENQKINHAPSWVISAEKCAGLRVTSNCSTWRLNSEFVVLTLAQPLWVRFYNEVTRSSYEGSLSNVVRPEENSRHSSHVTGWILRSCSRSLPRCSIRRFGPLPHVKFMSKLSDWWISTRENMAFYKMPWRSGVNQFLSCTV